MVAAFRSDLGASRRLLTSALDRELALLASAPLMIEYEAVSTRPEHLLVVGLSANEVNTVLDAVAKVAIPVALRFLWRPQLKDPADEIVLETAVNGNARLAGHFQHAASRPRRPRFRDSSRSAAEAWKQVQKLRRSNVALRLQESLLAEARRVSESEAIRPPN